MARILKERINVIASQPVQPLAGPMTGSAKEARLIYCRPCGKDCFVALRASRNDHFSASRHRVSELLADVVIDRIAAAPAKPDREAEQHPHQRELVAAIGPEVAVLPLEHEDDHQHL